MEEQENKIYELRFEAFQLSIHKIYIPGKVHIFKHDEKGIPLSDLVPVISCGMEPEFTGRMVYAGGVLFRSVKLFEKNDGWDMCQMWHGLELGMYRDDFQLLINQLRERIKNVLNDVAETTTHSRHE